MALVGKLETEVEIKAPAEKFYTVFKSQCHHVPTISPGNVLQVDVHQGDWETPGSVKIWNLTVDGKPEVIKETVELDDENKAARFVCFEGDLFKYYKTFIATYQATQKANHTVVKLHLEYEKLSEDFPAPDKSMDIMISVTKDIDAHLIKP